MHQVDQPSSVFEVSITDDNNGPGGHIGNSQNRKFMVGLLGHSSGSSCTSSNDPTVDAQAEEVGVKPLLP
jgi:hypothetical protein